MVVVTDTTPLNYLILIGQAELLFRLYGQVTVPNAVCRELASAGAQSVVRRWMADRPAWIEVRESAAANCAELSDLGAGEREAILLAHELDADVVLLDERRAANEAIRRRLRTIGTLGVLDAAAAAGLVDLDQALKSLTQTSFFVSETVLQALRRRHGFL